MPASRHPKASSQTHPALLLGLAAVVMSIVGCGSAIKTATRGPRIEKIDLSHYDRDMMKNCKIPELVVPKRELALGETVTLTGTGWGNSCYDLDVNADGSRGPAHSLHAMRIVIEQGGEEYWLGTVDAEDDFSFTTEVQVPLDLKTGDATFNVQVDQTNDWKPPGWPVTLTYAPSQTTLAD